MGAEEVAIKIPLSRDKELALINEIQLNGALYMKLTEIESKNIVRYLSFDKYDNWIVMVMKYVEGGSLRDLIGKPGRSKGMDAETAVRSSGACSTACLICTKTTSSTATSSPRTS